MELDNTKAHSIIKEVKRVINGKDDCIEKVMAAILAKGHILLEDVPGVGKTEMALAFSRAIGLQANRVQFTPDVLPSDITGFSMYRKETGDFIYHPGAVMCNLLLADEINRTSPKTQSALLEVMEEGNVTVDGVTRAVPNPFIVIATQNPVGSYGTQRLPEAQVDRFLICTSMGYPSMEDEVAMLKARYRVRPLESVEPVASRQMLLDMQEQTAAVYIHDSIYQYLVMLADATRHHSMVELGLSPRGTISLGRLAQAYAFLEGRDYVIPKDVRQAIPDVSCHRLRLGAKARNSRLTPGDIMEEILKQVPSPKLAKR